MMRRLTLILVLLLVPALAAGEPYKLRAQGLALTDDLGATFGAGADCEIVWDTSDADNHKFDVVCPDATCMVYGSDADQDRGIACAYPEFHVCSDDETDLTECLSMGHDGTRAFITAADGADQMVLDAATMFLGGVEGTDNDVSMLTASDGSSRIGSRRGGLSTIGWQLYAQYTLAQLALDLSDEVGNALTIHNKLGSAGDCGHGAPETNPTLFIHSDTACPGGASLWIGMFHDQTSGNITTGAGNLILNPVSDIVVLNPGTQHSGRFVQSAEIQTTDATPTSCIGVAIASDQTYQITADVVVIQSDGAQSAGYKAMATFTNDGGAGAAQIGSTWVVAQESDAAMDIDITLSGDNAQVLVTGRASTMEWGCTATYSRSIPTP